MCPPVNGERWIDRQQPRRMVVKSTTNLRGCWLGLLVFRIVKGTACRARTLVIRGG